MAWPCRLVALSGRVLLPCLAEMSHCSELSHFSMAGAPSYSAAAAGALTSMRGDLEDVQRLDVQVRDRERQLEAQHAQTQALLHRIHEARAQAEGCRNTIARLVKEEAAVKEVAEATAASGGGEAWSDDNYSAALAHARSACQRAIDGLRERSRFATMLEGACAQDGPPGQQPHTCHRQPRAPPSPAARLAPPPRPRPSRCNGARPASARGGAGRWFGRSAPSWRKRQFGRESDFRPSQPAQPPMPAPLHRRTSG